ncbi:kinase-like domain-containing protein [Rhizophagus clarus]|uniref:Kinase-like domain-containing protein n=1 Tax=Rhizophagus clarus TaxID=94130 RepID=A0A8H3MC19_9GLOM|nr:kinase-like domain-containing protein [Rhizophagus clarus]
MSANIEMQAIENTNEWINLIEEAVIKQHIKFYEFKQFSNFQLIGAGSFGKVYCVNEGEKHLALKTFFNLDNITIKEIVRELKIQREDKFHDNIIRYHGITKFESETHINNNCMLVMEYADGGCLRSYLEKSFNKLTWYDKFNMAYQLAYAVSCLHSEGIVHGDLHSGNILIHQNTIKLTDFGLSNRIGASSNFQSKLLKMVSYLDPKILNRQRNNNCQSIQMNLLNEKSDIYGVGVLLWEISSGKFPFHGEDKQYDELIAEISQGLREKVVPNTPKDYIKIYTRCWDGEPDNRPTIYQVVDLLKVMITETDITENTCNQKPNVVSLSTINSESRRELSQLIQNFNKINIKEIDPIVVSSERDKLLFEKGFNIAVDVLNDLIFELLEKGIESKSIKEQIKEYYDNHNIKPREIYNWEIGTSKNCDKAFNLFLNASEKNHILAQFYVAGCYQYGYGTIKNEKLAFEYFEKVANKNSTAGQIDIGYCYEIGLGIKKDSNKAFYWYEKAANSGNMLAMHNLGNCYRNGVGVETDYEKAFELYKQSAEGGYSGGMTMSANLGSKVAQYNLGTMYEYGDGITKDTDKAIYWYEKAAKQGYQHAQNKLKKFKNQ